MTATCPSSMTLKRCFKCGTEKLVSDFYHHPKMADGTLGKCKDCTKSDVTKRYHMDVERQHEYERIRTKRPERKLKRIEYQRRRRIRNKQKCSAYWKVAFAVSVGKIDRRPCVVCEDPNSEAHHADYSKPLDVQWLCFKHHRQLHGQLKEIAA